MLISQLDSFPVVVDAAGSCVGYCCFQTTRRTQSCGERQLLSSEWEQYCYEIEKTRSLSLKADVHKTLLLLMLVFSEVAVLIWKTTKEYAARCGVHQSWSLAIPAVFSTPMSHEIVMSLATSAWLHNFPALSLLTLLSFHCLLRLAETRHFRWCEVQTF